MGLVAAIGHAVSTLVLVGLIWTIQVVHYPLFPAAAGPGFPAFEAAHSSRITAVIALPWAVQGLTTVLLLAAPPAGVPRSLVWLVALLAAVPVAVTVVWSVPAHGVLATGFDAAAHASLVATNWLRTAAWTLGGVAAVALLLLALRADAPQPG